MPDIKRQLDPIPFSSVSFNDVFWAPRLEKNRKVTLQHIYRQCEDAGRIDAFDLNFQRALPAPIVLIFGDSDVAKWLEAASFSLTTHPDPLLEQLVDRVADKIIAAQQPDGYLNTHFIVAQPEMRWKNLRDWHEMYCAGHLIEAAVAHYNATGNTKLLDALCRYADYLDAIFGSEPGKKRGYCGHPEIELALIKLYHATHNPRYLHLAAYFVDERGAQPHYYDLEARQRGEDPAQFWAKNYEYCQAHVPVRQQTKVVGHAVRAMYLLSAMADLAHENNDLSLLETCRLLWENLITRRMYITGGIGPSRDNEGFTNDYDLPDETAYAETCATIGLIMWNQRMLQFSGESKYADVIEQGLYNGFLGSLSLDGDRFFYENPLASSGKHHRQGWFECPCCPPNVARLLASLGGYFYSTGANDIWVHHYAQGNASLKVDQRDISVWQETSYPWNGDVNLRIGTAEPQVFTLHLRVPGWCRAWQLGINGVSLPNIKSQENGYIAIKREWRQDDVVQYRMDMPVQTVWAHPQVKNLHGRVALQRGPLVYCLEEVDHGIGVLDRIVLDPDQVLAKKFEMEFQHDLLGGVVVLRGKAHAIDESGWDGILYRQAAPTWETIDMIAIPYYAWDNRAPGKMLVWIPAKYTPTHPA